MKAFLRLTMLALLATACGSSDDDGDSTVARDAGTAPSDAGTVCAITAPRSVAVRAGGIVEVEATEAGGTTIEAAWATGFVPLQNASTLSARAPYDGELAQSLTLTAACGAQATVMIAVLPLEFEAVSAWEENTAGPDSREHPMMWIDPSNADRLFLYGGLSFDPRQFTVVADLWAYDLAASTWSPVSTTNAPMLAAGRLAVDPSTGVALYEGGSDQANMLPFSLASIDPNAPAPAWTNVTPTSAPAGGATLHGFVFDEPRGRYLSIAGFRSTGLSNGVWSYDPASGDYEELTTTGGPPSPRYGFFLAHDRTNERVVIYSGAQQGTRANPVNPATDTWALELAEDPPRWVELFGADLSPPGRRNGCSAVDEAGHRFFVWGGTPDARSTQPGLFALDLTRGAERWTRIDPEGPAVVRSSCAAIYDPGRRRILFGFGNNSNSIYADFNALPL